MNAGVNAYRDAYRRAQEDPEGFWSERAEALHWERRWDRVLDASRAPFYRWFTGGRISTCYNALDRHVEQGRGEQAALIYDSPVTGTVAQLTYRELRERVARFAGALAAQGVGRGDRVVIYMPMVPEAVVAMLACARIGAVHSVVFGGFAPHELAKRIDDARPVMVISASCGREKCSGRPPMSAGWSATRTSSTRRCSPAAPASSTRASRSARRTPAPSGASSRSIGSTRYSRRRRRFAPSRRRIRTGR